MTQKINDKSQGDRFFATEFNNGIKNPIQSVMELLGMSFVVDAPLQTPLSFSIFNNLFQSSCVAIASSDPKIQVVNLKAPFEALSSNIKLEDGLTLKYKVLSAPDSIQDLSINFNNLGVKPIKDRFLTRNFILKSGSYVELTYKVDDDCFVYVNNDQGGVLDWNISYAYKKYDVAKSPINGRTYICYEDITGGLDPSLDVTLMAGFGTNPAQICVWQPTDGIIGSIVMSMNRLDTISGGLWWLMGGQQIPHDDPTLNKFIAQNLAIGGSAMAIKNWFGTVLSFSDTWDWSSNEKIQTGQSDPVDRAFAGVPCFIKMR